MICPKCGYEQEEGLDCLKCGIVFSKFYALHAPDKPTRSEAADVPPIPSLALEDGSSIPSFDLAELRQQVRDLARRSSELEFERAERLQIRSELRVLEKKYQTELVQFVARLEALEKKANEPPVPPVALVEQECAEWEQRLQHSQFDPLASRLDKIEQKLEKISGEARTPVDSQFLESLKGLDERIGDLEGELVLIKAENDARNPTSALLELQFSTQSLRAEVDSLRCAVNRTEVVSGQSSALKSGENDCGGRLPSPEGSVASFTVPPTEQQVRQPFEEDMRCIRESLDQIRQFITRLDPKG